jgi:hypothetical protein
MNFNQVWAVLRRPKGFALFVSIALYAIAVVLLVPPEQYVLACVIYLGVSIPLGILLLHGRALTRWNSRLEQRTNKCLAKISPLAESIRAHKSSIKKLDAYSHAADLNVGRIAALQNSLQERFDAFQNQTTQTKFQTEVLTEQMNEHNRSEQRLGALVAGLEQRLDALSLI